MYKKALMLTSFPDRSTYLLAPTTSNLSLAYCAHITCAFCSNIPSELSNIQLKTEVTSYLISESDRLPNDLASEFRQQFHLHHRIVMRHKSNGIKISHVEHHKHHGRIVAGTSLLMKRGQTTSMSKIFNFLL